MSVKGRVWKFGDDLSTDLMMPTISRYGHVPESESKYYCMSANRPEFSRAVQPGDVVIAGKHCGIGSSRPAPRMFRQLEVGAVIAESFSAIFFRNAIAIGFPVIELPGVISLFEDGDQCEVSLDDGIVKNLTAGKELSFSPYPEVIRRVFDLGGVKGLLREEFKNSAN